MANFLQTQKLWFSYNELSRETTVTFTCLPEVPKAWPGKLRMLSIQVDQYFVGICRVSEPKAIN